MRQSTNSPIKDNILSVLKGGDVLFMVPPVTTASSATLGIHILQSIAEKKGFKAEILYLDILLASVLGIETIENLSNFSLSTPWRFLGERLFARSAYGLPKLGISPESCSYEAMSVNGDRQDIRNDELQDFELEQYWKIEEICKSFVDEVVLSIASLDYKIIGCTARMEQINCSIAILNGIKHIRTNVITLIGGSNCEGEMAEGIASLTDSIDYIFSGESELSFSDFLDQYLNGELPSSRIIIGEPLKDLDSLPLPDYESFVDQKKKFLDDELYNNQLEISYETSRGCWWGECTFCGQHEDRVKFRQKKAVKVLHDLEQIYERYPNGRVLMCDNIMPFSFRKELLPVLMKRKETPIIFYMQKANLELTDLINLKNSNILQITPGIESFSSSLLKIMNKGVSSRKNLLLLRNAYSAGIYTTWFLLWGFPGDKAEYYEEMLKIFPLIRHLQPPSSFFHMRFERFSSYFEKPRDYQINNFRPWAVYKMIYPGWADINKLAYYFAGDYPCEAHENPDVIRKLADEVKLWRNLWEKTRLLMTPSNDSYLIYDNRDINKNSKTHVVNFAEAREIMTSCVYKETECLKWALDEKLGVIADSCYVPLITASPELLLKFEEN